jgi:hypothetical protein
MPQRLCLRYFPLYRQRVVIWCELYRVQIESLLRGNVPAASCAAKSRSFPEDEWFN